MAEVFLVKLPEAGCNWTLPMSQLWGRQWLVAVRQQAITCANVDLDLCSHMASPGHNELTFSLLTCSLGSCKGAVSSWGRAGHAASAAFRQVMSAQACARLTSLVSTNKHDVHFTSISRRLLVILFHVENENTPKSNMLLKLHVPRNFEMMSFVIREHIQCYNLCPSHVTIEISAFESQFYSWCICCTVESPYNTLIFLQNTT